MGNKKKMIAINGEYIKKRLKAIGSTQVKLAQYLDVTPRHLNRCIQANEMSEVEAVRTCNYLDVNVSKVIVHPSNFGINTEILDGLSFSKQYQISLKEPDSQKKLFYLLMRYCGRSEREIFSYTDDAVFSYMKKIQMFIEDSIIEPHLQYMRQDMPQVFDFIMQTENDSVFESEWNHDLTLKKKESMKKHNREKKIKNIDQGKLFALCMAGFSEKDIASEFNLDIEDIRIAIQNMKEGDAND